MATTTPAVRRACRIPIDVEATLALDPSAEVLDWPKAAD